MCKCIYINWNRDLTILNFTKAFFLLARVPWEKETTRPTYWPATVLLSTDWQVAQWAGHGEDECESDVRHPDGEYSWIWEPWRHGASAGEIWFQGQSVQVSLLKLFSKLGALELEDGLTLSTSPSSCVIHWFLNLAKKDARVAFSEMP